MPGRRHAQDLYVLPQGPAGGLLRGERSRDVPSGGRRLRGSRSVDGGVRLAHCSPRELLEERGSRLHKLRHTYASLLAALSEPMPNVMAQLGHADPKFTLRVYAHQMRRGDEDLSRVKRNPDPPLGG